MSLLNRILNNIQNEKAKGNHLVGPCQLSSAAGQIEGPFLQAGQMFPRIKKLIENTESELLIALYKFQAESDGGKLILAGLENLKKKAEKSRKKITVRFVINKKSGPASLVSGDGRSSPLNLNLPYLQSSEFFNIQIANHEHQLFDSTHSKMIVSDQKHMAVLTGDPNFKNTLDAKTSWIEVGTLCHNKEVVHAARQQFSELWNSKQVKLMSPNMKKENIQQIVQPISNAAKDNHNTLFLGKKPFKNPASDFHSPYKIALLNLINKAKKSVKIMVNNINDKDIISALLVCAGRGVKVQLVVGKYHGESAESLPFAGGTNEKTIAYIMEHATPLQHENLQIRWACRENQRLVDNMQAQTIHAKVVMVDSEYVLTGSSLMDRQSLRSGESDILFQSESLAKKYQQTVFNPVFEKARNVSLVVPTRNQIQERLVNARKTDDFIKLTSDYMLMRENENEYNGIAFFQKKIKRLVEFSRTNKIKEAECLLSYLKGDINEQTFRNSTKKCMTDGLLGKIYSAYQASISNHTKIALGTMPKPK